MVEWEVVAQLDPGTIYGLEAASGKVIEAEVASTFGAFIGLQPGPHRPDE